MATISSTPGTITIDRETRHALHAHAERALDTAIDRLTHMSWPAERATLAQGAAVTSRTVALMDAIGFGREDDRDEFEVPVTAELVSWLRTEALPAAQDDLDDEASGEAEQARDALAALLERLDGAAVA